MLRDPGPKVKRRHSPRRSRGGRLCTNLPITIYGLRLHTPLRLWPRFGTSA